MLVEPYAFNDLTTNVFGNTKAMISVDSILHFYDNYTRGLHPKVRKCIFEVYTICFFLFNLTHSFWSI